MSSSNIIDAIVGKYTTLFGDVSNLLLLCVVISIACFLLNLLKKFIEKMIEQISDNHKENSIKITRRFAPPSFFLFLFVLFMVSQKWITAGFIAFAALYYFIIRKRIPKLPSIKFDLICFVLLLIITFVSDLAVYDYRLSKNDKDFKVIFILSPSSEPKFITQFEAFTHTWNTLKQSELKLDKKIKIFPDPRPSSLKEFSSKYSLNQEKNIILYGIEKSNPIDIIVMCQWLTSDETKDYFRIRPFRIRSKPRLLDSFDSWEPPEGMKDCKGPLEEVVNYAKIFIIEEKDVSNDPHKLREIIERSTSPITEKNIKTGYEKDLNTMVTRYEE